MTEADLLARGYTRREDGTWRAGRNRRAYHEIVCARCGKTAFAVQEGRYCSRDCSSLASRQVIVTYGGAHDRVEAARGSASEYPCVDSCGRHAQDWSYTEGCADELVDDQGKRYCGHPEH